ncbi:hypothetical protein ACOSP7_022249 [Xanthoceras sorbifolium]
MTTGDSGETEFGGEAEEVEFSVMVSSAGLKESESKEGLKFGEELGLLSQSYKESDTITECNLENKNCTLSFICKWGSLSCTPFHFRNFKRCKACMFWNTQSAQKVTLRCR